MVTFFIPYPFQYFAILAAGLDLDEYVCISTISGDGLVHEVINGLMKHAHWAKAIKIPLGLIPGCTGNGLAVTLGTRGYHLKF